MNTTKAQDKANAQYEKFCTALGDTVVRIGKAKEALEALHKVANRIKSDIAALDQNVPLMQQLEGELSAVSKDEKENGNEPASSKRK